MDLRGKHHYALSMASYIEAQWEPYLPQTTLRAQKAAARHVTNTASRDHITSVLKQPVYSSPLCFRPTIKKRLHQV